VSNWVASFIYSNARISLKQAWVSSRGEHFRSTAENNPAHFLDPVCKVWEINYFMMMTRSEGKSGLPQAGYIASNNQFLSISCTRLCVCCSAGC
jgi:hypothetical protein